MEQKKTRPYIYRTEWLIVQRSKRQGEKFADTMRRLLWELKMERLLSKQLYTVIKNIRDYAMAPDAAGYNRVPDAILKMLPEKMRYET